jgi:amino acid adenylation domain-containing protein
LVPPQGEEVEVGETLIEWEYNTDIFDAETIERMSSHYVCLLEAVVADPESSVGELPMLCEAELRQLLVEFNDTLLDYPRDRTVSELFEEQAAMRPDCVAVVDTNPGDGGAAKVSLSYSQLNRESNRLGRLLQSKGVTPGVLVALLADRSIEMMVAILGVLKAGGAYLPIDPEYPSARIRYMLEDSRTGIVLIQSHAMETVNIETTLLLDRVYLDEPVRDETGAGDGNPVSSAGSGDLVYVMYTSGSTGRPKGVMVEHRNVVRLVKNSNYVDFNTPLRLIQTGATVFDAVTFEMWGTLLNGGQLYFAAKEIILDASKLGEAMAEYCVNTLWISISLFNQLTRQDSSIYSGLKYILTGGELMVPLNINKVVELNPGLNMVSCYGPTENTTFSSTFLVERPSEKVIPLGKPISNSTAYVLDKHNRLQPIGVCGELCVGGDGVSRGYLNRPELTAAKFISLDRLYKSYRSYKSYSKKEMFYRTGDLARWLPDGNLEFLGRIDHQVKLRGFRIEMEEIENQLNRCEGIKDAIVLCRSDEGGDKYLCAYVACDTPGDLDLSAVKDSLAGELPVYMIPPYIIPMETFPLNVSGKVDRSRLPEPHTTAGDNLAGQYTAPTNDLERKLVEIWAGILEIDADKIGIEDNFFDRGGHSLKAAAMMSLVHKTLDVKVNLAEIFRKPYIRDIAAHIEKLSVDRFIPVQAVEEKEYYPLSPPQRRLYYLQQLLPSGIGYNMPVVLQLQGYLDSSRLKDVLERIIMRHEILRTSFFMAAGEPVQRVHESVGFEIEYYCPCCGETVKELHDNIIRDFIRPFDLACAPLLRIGLIKEEDQEHILLMDMHHIISDGISQGILAKDVMTLYGENPLPDLRVRYRDYSEWRNRMLRQEEVINRGKYWLNEFSGEIPVLNIPRDYPRPGIKRFEGKSVAFTVGQEESELLMRCASSEQVTLYMLLLAVTAIFLSKIGSQEDIVIGTPVAGRNHPDLESIVGMFVDTLAIRAYPFGHLSSRDFVQQIKTKVLSAFNNQDFPFDELVELVASSRDSARNPLFDVMFAFRNMDVPELRVPGLVLKPLDYGTGIAKFDLTITVIETRTETDKETADSLEVHFVYNTDLFKETTVERYVNYFKEVLRAVTGEIDKPLGEIEILTRTEREELLFRFNTPETIYTLIKPLDQLFEEQVAKTPDSVALVGIKTLEKSGERVVEQEIMSFRCLNETVNRMACYLLQQGVKPKDRVGLMVERSVEMIIGILTVLKCGCGYVPLNPREPTKRLTYIMDECCVRILLTQSHLLALKPVPVKYRCIVQYNNYPAVAVPVLEKKSGHRGEDIAYIIFTSGSTGKPKGVPITHANISPFMHWGYKNLAIASHERALQNLAYYFDWSVSEIFFALTAGASLYMAPDEILLNPKECIAFINRNKISTLHTTPTQWQYLVNEKKSLHTLSYLFIGAEKLTFDLVKRTIFLVSPGCRLFNMYGPTEATIISAVLEIDRSRLEDYQHLTSIPIGKPVANFQLLVFDNHMNLCPVNVVGELYILGDGVAAGYLNSPELTADKFISSPFTHHSSPLYKTGDLVRWLPDGTIEFLGRIDHQVKIRGQRIELGEIENQLLSHPAIIETVIIDREDKPGERYLCAYIVVGADLDDSELREYLLLELPSYMIPDHFVRLQGLPINPNGKIDRKSLPEPAFNAAANHVPPGNRVEEQLVEIWAEELGKSSQTIGIEDDFFTLGIHSLSAMKLVSRVNKTFDVNIPLTAFFRTRTIGRIAKEIDRWRKKQRSMDTHFDMENKKHISMAAIKLERKNRREENL